MLHRFWHSGQKRKDDTNGEFRVTFHKENVIGATSRTCFVGNEACWSLGCFAWVRVCADKKEARFPTCLLLTQIK